MEIAIHIDCSSSLPFWVIDPVGRQVDSRLWTRGAKYCKAARRGGLAIHRSKTFRNLQFSHLPAHPNQFMVSVLCSEVNWMVWWNGVDIRTYQNFIGESIVSDSSQFLEKNSGLRFYIPLHQSHNIPRHPRWKRFVGDWNSRKTNVNRKVGCAQILHQGICKSWCNAEIFHLHGWLSSAYLQKRHHPQGSSPLDLSALAGKYSPSHREKFFWRTHPSTVEVGGRGVEYGTVWGIPGTTNSAHNNPNIETLLWGCRRWCMQEKSFGGISRSSRWFK